MYRSKALRKKLVRHFWKKVNLLSNIEIYRREHSKQNKFNVQQLKKNSLDIQVHQFYYNFCCSLSRFFFFISDIHTHTRAPAHI